MFQNILKRQCPVSHTLVSYINKLVLFWNITYYLYYTYNLFLHKQNIFQTKSRQNSVLSVIFLYLIPRAQVSTRVLEWFWTAKSKWHQLCFEIPKVNWCLYTCRKLSLFSGKLLLPLQKNTRKARYPCLILVQLAF